MEETNGQAPSSSPLRLRRDQTVGDPGKPCPACNASIPSDAVLCVHCGFDLRKGKPIKPHGGLPHLLAVLLSVVLGLMVSAIAIVALLNIFMDRDPAPEPPTHEQPAPSPLGMPEDTVEKTVESDEKVDDELVEKASPIEPEPAIEIAEPDPFEEEALRHQREQELRVGLRSILDERVPLRQVGDEVALRQQNGFIHRGRIVSMRVDRLAIIDEGERTVVIYDQLDANSRAAVDPVYREVMIEQRLKTQLENMDAP